MAQKIDGKTMNLTVENLEKIKELFPEVFNEEKIDFEKLQVLLGENIDKDNEKYAFTWKGKMNAIKLAQLQSTGTLLPCKEKSKNWDTTENLYIEGDNLEVLKLLQKSYVNKVKMIYIDPPYNTGNDFVYEDDFADNIANYKEITGQATKSNAETQGRYHTNWLNMMYPRLKLARNLLTNDGVIFISIDDNEQANLKKLCDEIFGENNFIGNICHKARASVSNDKIISPNHNSILFYSKNINVLHPNRHTIGVDPVLEGFNQQDQNGRYKLVPVDGPGGAKKGNPYYEFLGVTGYWRFSKETMQEKYQQGLVVKTETSLQQKYYLEDAKESRRTETTWFDKDYLTSNATKELTKLMGGSFFDNPKNINLLVTFLKMMTHYDKDSLVLDFFSGSATTAHAVMQLNAEDGGNRKFIMVQLPELIEENSEAYKAGYRNICEIGQERIRRTENYILEKMVDQKLLKQALKTGQAAADFINTEENKKMIEHVDFGFKVFKLDNSNIKKWDNSPTENIDDIKNRIQQSLFYLTDGRTDMDAVYEIMLKFGLPLTLPINKKNYGNAETYIIKNNDYKVLICLSENIKISEVEEMANESIGTYIFADRCFSDANDLINTEELLKKKDKQMRLF